MGHAAALVVMGVGLAEGLAILVWLPAAIVLFCGPWYLWARQAVDDRDRHWPRLTLALALGIAVSALVGYALIVAHVFAWWLVWLIDVACAALAMLRHRRVGHRWVIDWEPLPRPWNRAMLGLVTTSIAWRAGQMVLTPGPRGPDAYLHLQFLSRALQDIAPTGSSNLYPLGMHGWIGAWSLGLDPSGLHLWLPLATVLLSTAAAAMLALKLVDGPAQRIAAFAMFSWVGLNPFGIVVAKTISPFPQAPAFALLWLLVLLLLLPREQRGGFGVPVWLAAAVAAMHSLTALYAALMLLPWLAARWWWSAREPGAADAPRVGPLGDAGDAGGTTALLGRWWAAVRADPIPLLVVLALPMFVANQTIWTASVEWRSAFEEADQGPFVGTYVLDWSGEVPNVTWEGAEAHEQAAVLGLDGAVLVPSGTEDLRVDLSGATIPNGSSWGLSVAVEGADGGRAVLDLLRSDAPSEPPRFRPVSRIGANVTATNVTPVEDGCLVLVLPAENGSDRAEDCSPDGDLWSVELPAGDAGWYDAHVLWSESGANLSLDRWAVWRGPPAVNASEWLATLQAPAEPIVLRPGDAAPGIEVFGDAPLWVSLDWKSAGSADCEVNATGAPQPWRAGTSLVWPIPQNASFSTCDGAWTLTATNGTAPANRTGNVSATVVGVALPTLACSDPPTVEADPQEASVWGTVAVNCQLTNAGNQPVARTLTIGDVSGLATHQRIKGNQSTVFVLGGGSNGTTLRLQAQALPAGTTWSVPIVAGDLTTWIDLRIGTPEVTIETEQQSIVGWALKFFSWKPDTEWLATNGWWFGIAALMHLALVVDRGQRAEVRAFGLAGLVLQTAQATGILAYPAPWGQARLAQHLVLPLGVAFVALPARWGPVLHARLLAWRSAAGASGQVAMLQRGERPAIIGLLLVLVLLGFPDPGPIVGPYPLWQAANAAPSGVHVTPTMASLHSGISDEPIEFIDAGVLLARWGHAEDPLPDWRCRPDGVSIVLLTEDDAGRAPELREWLARARAAAPERWTLADDGDGWERWASTPPETSLVPSATRLESSLRLGVLQSSEMAWLFEDARGVTQQADAPVFDPAQPSADGRWWACDLDQGRISPLLRIR